MPRFPLIYWSTSSACNSLPFIASDRSHNRCLWLLKVGKNCGPDHYASAVSVGFISSFGYWIFFMCCRIAQVLQDVCQVRFFSDPLLCVSIAEVFLRICIFNFYVFNFRNVFLGFDTERHKCWKNTVWDVMRQRKLTFFAVKYSFFLYYLSPPLTQERKWGNWHVLTIFFDYSLFRYIEWNYSTRQHVQV